jgi:hypothetical protein
LQLVGLEDNLQAQGSVGTVTITVS